MEYEDILLSFNLDILLNIFEKMKEQSLYSGIMDLASKSSEFISTIVYHIEYYDVSNELTNEYDNDSEYDNFES